jgi:hypothetical protein
MWSRPDQYTFQANERMDGREGMGIAPAGEFSFVGEGGVRAQGSAQALKSWAAATAQHHGIAPWHPNYAPMPAGYPAPFADGLFGTASSGPRPRRQLRPARIGVGLLGAWMLFMAYKGRKSKEAVVVGGLGAGLLYNAWRG